jgi:hypothetical protein
MTKEEIRQAAQKEFAYQFEIGSKAPLEVREGFIKGAEWMQEKMQESNEGQALLYAVEKTAERTKREVIKKAAEWFEKYLFDIGYPDDWCRDSPSLISGKDRFIKAMQDESK